jgi:hypothetical protein
LLFIFIFLFHLLLLLHRSCNRDIVAQPFCPLQSGASLDDFQIIRCLGRGSSSRVFLVRLLRPELLSAALSPPAYLSSLNDSKAELPSVFALKVISKNDVVMRNRVSTASLNQALFYAPCR